MYQKSVIDSKGIAMENSIVVTIIKGFLCNYFAVRNSIEAMVFAKAIAIANNIGIISPKIISNTTKKIPTAAVIIRVFIQFPL